MTAMEKKMMSQIKKDANAKSENNAPVHLYFLTAQPISFATSENRNVKMDSGEPAYLKKKSAMEKTIIVMEESMNQALVKRNVSYVERPKKVRSQAASVQKVKQIATQHVQTLKTVSSIVEPVGIHANKGNNAKMGPVKRVLKTVYPAEIHAALKDKHAVQVHV